jgi:hypothetical protein
MLILKLLCFSLKIAEVSLAADLFDPFGGV